MSSAPTDCRVPEKVPDPTDAQAADQFVNRRAGYGDGRLQRITHAARQGWTLSAGEGAVLVEEIDRLRDERDAMEGAYRHHVAVALGAIERLNRAEATLAALRAPSDAVIVAMQQADSHGDTSDADCSAMLAAAVAAVLQEVNA